MLNTITGYVLTIASYCPKYDRLSGITIGAPLYARHNTQGLSGTLDGNATNDFVDASGFDWLSYYRGEAAFSFAQTWRVAANQSLFVLAQTLNLLNGISNNGTDGVPTRVVDCYS